MKQISIDDFVYNNLGEIYTSCTNRKTASFSWEDDAEHFFQFLGDHPECYSRRNVRMGNGCFLVEFEVR